MSIKNSYTTADYIEWNTAINLVHKLYKDGKFRMSLLIGCGIFFGLRISDILQLTWDMLLSEPTFVIIEKKTQKRREVKINTSFQEHIKDCYRALDIKDEQEKCFMSPRGGVYSIQRINVLLKEIKQKYNLKSVKNFSSHSLRKSFGRHVYEMADTNAEMALVLLSELYNHSNISITKRYLGIRHEELMGVYDIL